jgi:hypothetical protein
MLQKILYKKIHLNRYLLILTFKRFYENNINQKGEVNENKTMNFIH